MDVIYAGSFDPFTNGHLDIIKQARGLFDDIHIVIANNSGKSRNYNTNDTVEAIKNTLKANDIHNFTIVAYGGLVSDYAKLENIRYIIRGLRNSIDYQYEENISKINKALNPNLNTIYFRSNMEIVSSSMVRELFKYGKDVSEYVSPFTLKIMKGE